MLSYRYMRMPMNGSLVGTDGIADEQIVSPAGENFLVTPERMQMHMLGAMLAPTGDLTLLAMVPILSNEMDHVTRMGGTFTTASSGLGDVKLTALYVLARPERQRLHANLGLSLPTGTITARDETPMGEQLLPYPMQLGSGTFDLLPGVTYLGEADVWSWGAQAMGTVRLSTNDHDYRLGNAFAATAWGARRFTEMLSASLRLEGTTWGNIAGADPAYAMAVTNRMVPTVFPDLRGGSRLDVGLGVNFFVPEGALNNVRVGIEGLATEVLQVAREPARPDLAARQLFLRGQRCPLQRGVYVKREGRP